MCSLNTVQYHNQSKELEKSLKYLNMGFTGMFSVETVLKIIGFGVKVGTNHETPATIYQFLSTQYTPYPHRKDLTTPRFLFAQRLPDPQRFTTSP